MNVLLDSSTTKAPLSHRRTSCLSTEAWGRTRGSRMPATTARGGEAVEAQSLNLQEDQVVVRAPRGQNATIDNQNRNSQSTIPIDRIRTSRPNRH